MKTNIRITLSGIVLLFLLQLLPYSIYGQSIANYTFGSATGGSLVLDQNSNAIDMTSGTTQLIGFGLNDVNSAVLDIGFDFWFMGVKQTKFSANDNGVLRFGTTVVTNTQAVLGTAGMALLSPFAQNQMVSITGKVHTKLVGSSPNRCRVVEWKNMSFPNTSTTSDGSYQLRIYETSGIVEFVYGEMRVSGGITPATFNVGISSGSSATTCKTVNVSAGTAADNGTPTANAYTSPSEISNLHSTSDGSRTIYTFTPALPSAPSAFNFTTVTQVAMTPNWTDNSSNEVGFAYYRSDDGGTTYNFVAQTAAGAVTAGAQANLLPGKTYFWKVVAVSEGGVSSELTGSQAANAAGTKLYSGASGGTWATAGNWTPAGAPAATDDVTIPDGVNVLISAAGAVCNNLTVGQGTTGQLTLNAGAATLTVNGDMTVSAGGTFTNATASGSILNIGGSAANTPKQGNLTVNGTFDLATGVNSSVIFYGSANALITGTGATLDFYTITVNKGTSAASILSIDRAFTVGGSTANGPVIFGNGLTAGTLKITGTFTQTNNVFTTGAPVIAAPAGLWIDNSNFTVTAQTNSSACNGLFRISNGTYNIGTASGNSLSFGAGGTFMMEGGTLNIAGRLDQGGAGNVLNYIQTGGTVTLGTVANAATTATLDLGTSSNSFMKISGGSITIQKSNTNATVASRQDFRNTSTTIEITGGSISFGNGSTGAATTFYAQGSAPAVIISNNSGNHNLTLRAVTYVNGDFDHPGTGTVNLGGFQLAITGTINNAGTMTANVANSKISFYGTAAQTLGGTLTGPAIANVVVNNSAGVTITPTTTINTSLTLADGTLSCGGALTVGMGGANAFTMVRGNGTIAVAPTYNLGTGADTWRYDYLGTGGAQTIANELTGNLTNTGSSLTINNFNGVTLNAARNVLLLKMYYGNLSTDTINLLTVTGTTAASVVGGSNLSYVNGPLARNFAALASATYTFPIGKSGYQLFELVNTTTTLTQTLRVEAFDADCGGTVGTGMFSLNTNRYWRLDKTAGTGVVNPYTIRVTESGITTDNALSASTAVAGTYSNIGITLVGSTLASNAIAAAMPAPRTFYCIGEKGHFTGTFNIPSGTYKSLTCAATGEAGSPGIFQAINSGMVTGNITIVIDGDLTLETGTNALNQTTESPSGSNFKISIVPDAATLRTVSATVANSLIRLDGADRVVFDGSFSGSGQYLRFRNYQGSNPTFEFLNDARNNKLANCIFESNNTAGSGTIRFGVATAGTLGNDLDTITGCDIRDRSDFTGVPNVAIYSAGTAAKTNSDNTIKGNTIRNFTTSAISIPASNNGNNWVIGGNNPSDGNNIYNEANRAALTPISVATGNGHIIKYNSIYQTAGDITGTFTGIYVIGGAITNGIVISNNSIGGRAANCGGTAMTITVAGAITGITMNVADSPVADVQGNTISNISMTSTGAASFNGISLSGGVANIGTTTGNTIGGAASSISFAGTGPCIGINVGTTGAGFGISNNLVSNITSSSASAFTGIYALTATTSGNSLQNNTIKNITLSSAGASSFKGINLGTGMFNCGGTAGNTIGDASSTNNISVAGTGTTIGINSSSATSTLNISNNIIANMTASGTAATVAVRGIVQAGNCALTISGNTVRNLTTTSTNAGTTTSASVLGISVSSTTAGINISQNTIHTLNNNSVAAAAVSVTGLYLSGAATGTNYIARNFIHSLNTTTTSVSYIHGIEIAAGIVTVHNNMVRLGIKDDGVTYTGNHWIRGIYKNTTANNDFYYNSVYIGGTGVTSNTNTFGFFRFAVGTDVIKNNIFVNNRQTSSGSGNNYAIYIINNTTLTSNYNLFYATGLSNNYCGLNNGTTCDLLTDWRTSTGQDAQSVYGDPAFISATGDAATVDLHLSTSLETQAESGGTNVAIIDDYDATGLRASGNYPLGGQLNLGGTAVDIGADEGDFKPQDLTPPVISYTPLAHQSTFTAPTLSGVSITDAGTGVNVTSGTNPRIYFKRSSDANTYNDNTNSTDGWKWVETSSGGTPFSLTLDYTILNGGATNLEGAVIQYFVVAQDNATVPNVQINSGTFNSAASSVALAAGNFPITGTINSYVIKIFNGTYTVGTGGTAPTLTNNGGFFQMINTGSLSGNVTINVISDLTEDGTNPLFQWTESGVGGYSVKITTNSTTERLVSGAVANSMIRIDGADKVTFDGQYSGDGLKHLRFRNTNTSNATFSFINDASDNTIQNCYVESANSGTSSGAIIIGTTNGSTGNDNITIKNNKIGNYTTTYPANGIYTQGTATKVNNDITIEGNEIFNFTNMGIYVCLTGPGTGNNWIIRGNHLYNTVGTFATAKGIYFDGGAGSNNNLIKGNYIGGATASCGGAAWTNTYAGTFMGIYLNAGTATKTTIEDNVIQNILMSSTGGVDLWGINIAAGSADVNNNTIGHATTANSLQNNGQWTTAGIVNESDGLINITNNTIANMNGNYAGTNVHVVGIYSDNGITQTNITGNTIKDLTTLSTATAAGTSIATTASVAGISDVAVYSNTIQNISNNTISHLLNNRPAVVAVSVVGIECKGNGSVGTDITFVDGNFIHSLEANVANTSAIIYGIHSNGASWINTTISNNMIRLGIRNDGSSLTQSATISGIAKSHVYSLKLYHNSVYIGGTSVVSGAINTNCFNRITVPTTYSDDYRNNIFVNNRSNTSGTGKHYCIRLVNATNITACDYNIFQSTGTGGVMGVVNTTDYSDIPTWQTGTGFDAHSGQADPVFVNPTGNGTAVDLHLQTNNPCEGAGTNIAAITVDIDNDNRAANTPVDIGADCGGFTFIDNSAPVITFTPLANAVDINNRTLSGVNIYDYSTGVPTTGSLRPRIWYRDFTQSSAWVSNGGTLTAGTSTNGTWSFVIDYSLLGLGSITGDSIEYYIVAQDQATTPNIGYNRTAVHTDVNTQTSAPATPNGYVIALYSGSYNVGTGERFLTLTGAGGFFRSINTGTVTGDIVLNVTSDITEPGTYPLNQWAESPASSNYTITIQPNNNTMRILSGNYNGASAAVGGLFRIDGADRLTIDGRDPGNLPGGGQYLTFRNISNTAASNFNSCFTLLNDATNNTIKYCILEGSSVGQSCGVVLFSTSIGTLGNSNTLIDYCDIKQAGANLPVNGIASMGTNAAPNINNTVSNCNIYNFFSATIATAGIRIGAGVGDVGSASWTINANSFYQTGTRTMTNALGEYRVIYIYTPGNTGYVITNNYIGGGAASCAGTAWTQTAGAIADNFNGMWLYGGGAIPSFSVQGNIIKNISFSSTGASASSAGINIQSGSANIGTVSGNVIGGATGTNLISFSSTGGRFDGIYCNTSTALNIRNNSIGAITLGGAGSSFNGIFVDGAAPSSLTIDNNVIGSNTTSNSIENGINTGLTCGIKFNHASSTAAFTISNNTIKNLFLNTIGASAKLAGIHTTGGSLNITGNNINNLSTISQNVGTGASQLIIGIYTNTNAAGQTATITGNNIHTLKFSPGGMGTTAVKLAGIYYEGTSTATNIIKNNLVHSFYLFTNPNAAEGKGIEIGSGNVTVQNNMVRLGIDHLGNACGYYPAFTGILDASTTANNICHNTVLITGASGDVISTATTYAYRRTAANGADDIRNNIFANNRTGGNGSSKHYSFVSNTLTGIASMDYNIYYSNDGNLFSIDGGTTSYANPKLQRLRAAISGQNLHSGIGTMALINFVTPSGDASTVDLHLNNASCASGAGFTISGITTDYDGATRNNPPDIGADEGAFTPLDVTTDIYTPIITFTNIPDNSIYTNYGFNSITVTDAGTGVASAGGNAPHVWYKNLTTTSNWISAEGTYNGGTGKWDFVIDYSLLTPSGLLPMALNTIQYYVTAQDNATTPNCWYHGFEAATPIHPDVNTQTTPPGTPLTYNILPTFSGTINVGPSETPYKTFTRNADGIFKGLNSGILSGDLTILVTGDITTEDGVTALNQIVESGPGGYTITVQPSGGVSRSVSGTNATSLFTMNGCRRIVWDGIDASLQLTFSNTGAGATWTLQNDATDIKFKYLNIKGVNTVATSGVIVFGATTGTTGNDNISLRDCDIHDGATTPRNLIYCAGTAAKENSNDTIDNCNLYNFFESNTGTSCGILLASNNTDWQISNNRVYQTSARVFTVTTQKYHPISVIGGNNYLLQGNIIGYGSSTQTGATTISGQSGMIRGIHLNVGTITPSSVQDNTIAGITHSSSRSVTTAGENFFIGIFAEAGRVDIGNVTPNKIGVASGTGALTLSSTATAAAATLPAVGILNAGTAANTISGNIFENISVAVANVYCPGWIGIKSESTGSTTISNNTIGGTAANSILVSASAAMNTLQNIGISTTAGINTISGNTLRNLSSSSINNSGSGSAASIVGILQASTSSGQTISGNTLHTLANSGATTNQRGVTGIVNTGAVTGTNSISGNFIHSLNVSSTNVGSTIKGILISAGVFNCYNNMIRLGIDAAGASIADAYSIYGIEKGTTANNTFYFNTVYIGGSGLSVATASYSSPFARTTSPSSGSDDLRNNIFVNERSSSGGSTQKHYACVLNNRTGITCDYNIYHASGTNGVLFYVPATAYTTLQAWRALPGNNDLHSGVATISQVNFANATGNAASVDLHLNNPNSASGAGIAIASVTTDYDGVSRNDPPEIGADESAFTPLSATTDIYSPTITLTALPPQGICITPSTITVTVTDVGTGLSTSASQPRMFIRKSTGSAPGTSWANGQAFTGTFVSGTAHSSAWSFSMDYATLGITPANNDEFEYYFTAADQATTPNIWYTTFNATTPIHTDVATFSTPQAGAFVIGTNRYKVLSGISGTVSVGTAGTYTSFMAANATGFIWSLNNSMLTGDLIVNVISDISEGANWQSMSAITQGCGNGHTITIQPDAGTLRTVSGTPAQPFFVFNGVSNLTIDGRNPSDLPGNGRFLLFRNLSNHATFWFNNGADTNIIRNAIIEGCPVAAGTATAGTALVVLGGPLASGSGIKNITLRDNFFRERTNAFGGYYKYGVLSSNSAGNPNSDISILNNEIRNWSIFSGGAGIAAAVYVGGTGNGNNWDISDNHLYCDFIDGTGEQYGIDFRPGTSSNNNLISGNYIGGSATFCGGANAWRNNVEGSDIVPLYLNVGTDDANPTVVSGNTIQNIQQQNGIGGGVSSIWVAGGRVNISSNTIGHATSVNSIMAYGGGSIVDLATGWVYGIYSQTTSQLNISGNTIGGLASAGAYYSYGTGIEHTAAGSYSITNNTIANCYNSGEDNWTSLNFIGIYISSNSTGNTISGNTIEHIGNSGGGAVLDNETDGIIVSGTNCGGVISNNKLSEFFHASNGGWSVGLALLGSGNWEVRNNMVNMYNQSWSTTYTTRKQFYGILDYTTGGDLKFYNNTVLIQGSQTGASGVDYPSECFYKFPGGTGTGNGATVDVKNNIFINSRTGSPTVNSKHYAIDNTAQTPSTTWTSNYNFISATTASTLGYWNGAGDQTFAQWLSSSGGDANSWSVVATTGGSSNTQVNPSDLFVDPSIGNLNIKTSSQTCWFVNGKGIAGASIGSLATDYGGGTRNATYGIGIDIGADEFNPDGGVLPHAITATPSSGGTNTFNFAGRTLGSITWGGGGSVPSSVAMRYYSGDYPTGMPGSMKKMNTYTNISETGGSGYTYNVTLNYDEALLGTVVNMPLGEGDMKFIKTIGGVWSAISTQSVNTTANSMTATGLTSFSDFTGADNITPLPVELLTFTGKCTGHSAILNWATATETNNDFFTLERSTDAQEWTEISRIRGAGNSNTITYYNSEDEFKTETTVYYRLRQTDFDGHSKEIGTLALNCNSNSADAFDVYPNPFTDNVFCTWAQNSEKIAIRLFNAEGVKVFEKSFVSGESQHQLLIELPGLASGIYTLEYLSGNSVVHKKLVKN